MGPHDYTSANGVAARTVPALITMAGSMPPPFP